MDKESFESKTIPWNDPTAIENKLVTQNKLGYNIWKSHCICSYPRSGKGQPQIVWSQRRNFPLIGLWQVYVRLRVMFKWEELRRASAKWVILSQPPDSVAAKMEQEERTQYHTSAEVGASIGTRCLGPTPSGRESLTDVFKYHNGTEYSEASHPLQVWRTNSKQEFTVQGPFRVHSDTEGSEYLLSPAEDRRSSGSCWNHCYWQLSLFFRFIRHMKNSKISHHALLHICVQSQKSSPRACVVSTCKSEI